MPLRPYEQPLIPHLFVKSPEVRAEESAPGVLASASPTVITICGLVVLSMECEMLLPVKRKMLLLYCSVERECEMLLPVKQAN